MSDGTIPLVVRVKEAMAALQNYDGSCFEMRDVVSTVFRRALSDNDSCEVILDALEGQYGDTVATASALALEGGFEELGGVHFSFLLKCNIANRMDLFESVVRLGMPTGYSPLKRRGHKYATTPQGIWLDLMCNCAGDSGDLSVTSAPMEIDRLSRTQGGQNMAATLARLLVEFDPEHRAIERIAGTPGHVLITAFLTEALMRRRLTLGAEEPVSSAPAPTSRRRERYV